MKKSPLISFFKRSHTKSEHDQEDVSPTSPTAGKLFGHPLGDICVETELPKSIMVRTTTSAQAVNPFIALSPTSRVSIV